MGAKFYRGGDKSKKIRKRVTQTRTWARTLKWVCCKYSSILSLFGKITLILPLLLDIHSKDLGFCQQATYSTQKWQGSKYKLQFSLLLQTL